jgi:hypothetical protein
MHVIPRGSRAVSRLVGKTKMLDLITNLPIESFYTINTLKREERERQLDV